MLKPFFVWKDKKLISLSPTDVILLETVGNYTKIVLSNETYVMVHTSLSSALKKLPSELFIRIHRSYAASIHFIDTIERDHLTIGKYSIPIARQYYKTVLEQLNVIE